MALYCLPDYQTSFESIAFSVQKKKLKIDFQDGSHLGFKIPTKFQISWPFSSGEQAKNRFSRW